MDRTSETAPAAAPQIEYVSSDLLHASGFAADAVRTGPNPMALGPAWPSSPARYFESGEGVQCVSIGPPGITDEYAIKRPIKEGERYSCLGTSFQVIRCLAACQAAVIQRMSRMSGPSNSGTLTSYMYVHDCLGVLAFSQNGNLTEGIPLDAELLRGEVGILAHTDYPACRH
jgi:hypothetical protein